MKRLLTILASLAAGVTVCVALMFYIQKLTDQDKTSGPHWATAINDYLRAPSSHAQAQSKP